MNTYRERLTPEKKERIVDLLVNTRLTLKMIGKRLGIDAAVVIRLQQKLGIVRPRGTTFE